MTPSVPISWDTSDVDDIRLLGDLYRIPPLPLRNNIAQEI